jgi:transposase
LEEKAMAGSKKKALTEGRIIVFVDESGLTQKPHRVRTWAPRGETPILQHHFNWDNLAAIAGITLLNFYFRLYEGSIKAEQVVDFLRHLLRHLDGKLLVVWDGLPAHRSKLVKAFLGEQHGRIWLERLPAYAPELNPVEYIWGYWKKHALPNFCPKDYGQLSREARQALARMRRRKTLVTAFWKQAELF